MARRTQYDIQRKFMVQRAREELSKTYRLRQLFNYQYRQSKLSRVSLLVRIIILLFISYLFFLDRLFLREKEEIVQKASIQERFGSRTNSSAGEDLVITTREGNTYAVDYANAIRSAFFSVGDTILVFKNVTGKRNYISALRPVKIHHILRFAYFENFSVLTAVLIIFSFFLQDVFDRMSRITMIITVGFAVGTVIIYLFL